MTDVDALIADLESRGLGWSLDHTGRLIEARIWDWPNVIGRYRPDTTEPLLTMLSTALAEVDLARFPVRNPDEKQPKISHKHTVEPEGPPF